MTVFVLCHNDYPHSVYWSETAARTTKRRLEQDEEARRERERGAWIYYHIHEVPFNPED